ncbi:MAG: hypothetical protein IH845_02445 [Nanoarchaeota archaeon]|nr:hypothetical protein [Nanoarchaeota archaeon]
MRLNYVTWAFCILLVLFIYLIYFVGTLLTGFIVFEPSVSNGCEPASMKNLWDGIFDIDSSDIIIYNLSFSVGEGCASYIMFKNDSNNKIYVVLREDTPQEQKTLAYVILGNTNLSDALNDVTDYASGLSFVNNGLLYNPNIMDRNIVDTTSASAEFSSVFNFDNSTPFFNASEGFSFVETEVYVGGSLDKTLTGHVVGGETIDYMEFINYTFYEIVTFENNISNYTFVANSGWNVAFDFGIYFDYGSDASFGFILSGVNNTNGEYIDFKIEGGDVLFMPVSGFIGSRDFIVYVNNSQYNAISNKFNVNIVGKLPEAPKIYKNISDIFLKPNKSLVINLSKHFSDEDSSVLYYDYTGGKTLNITISGDIMTILLGENFVVFDVITIIASDGVLSVSSEKIAIFLDKGDGLDIVIIENIDNDTTSAEFESKNETSELNNKSGDDLGVKIENIKWIIIGSLVFLAFIGVGFLVYSLMGFKKKGKDFERPKLVKNYLKKLRSQGVFTSFSSVITKPLWKNHVRVRSRPIIVKGISKVAISPLRRKVSNKQPLVNSLVNKQKVVPKHVIPKNFFKNDLPKLYAGPKTPTPLKPIGSVPIKPGFSKVVVPIKPLKTTPLKKAPIVEVKSKGGGLKKTAEDFQIEAISQKVNKFMKEGASKSTVLKKDVKGPIVVRGLVDKSEKSEKSKAGKKN